MIEMSNFSNKKQKVSSSKVTILLLLEPAVYNTDYESKMMPLIGKHLDTHFFNVNIICSSSGSRFLDTDIGNVHEIEHRFTRINNVGFWLEYILYLFKSVFKVIQIAKQTNTQLIISLGGHAYSGLVVTIVARVLRRKSVIRISEPTRYIVKKRYRFSFVLSALISIAESISFQLCDAIIANRDMSWYHSRNLSKQKVLSQGVDTTLFNTLVPPAFSSKSFPRLVTISRLDKQKNILNAISTIYLLKDKYPTIVYHIIGSGPDEKTFREEVKKLYLNGHVIFHDYLPPYRIPSILRSCDIFVLPSFIEGLPSAVLEAMACGVPVVLGSTKFGWKDWFINGENVILVEGSPQSIADAVTKLLSNKDLMENLKVKGLEYVRTHHNSETTKKEFAKIVFQELRGNTTK